MMPSQYWNAKVLPPTLRGIICGVPQPVDSGCATAFSRRYTSSARLPASVFKVGFISSSNGKPPWLYSIIKNQVTPFARLRKLPDAHTCLSGAWKNWRS